MTIRDLPAARPSPGMTAAWLLLVATGLAFYAWAWGTAPVVEGDSAQYMEVARDLSDFHLDTLHDRSPGYPLLVMLTGSADTPARALFYVSLILHGMSVWLLMRVLIAVGVGQRWLLIFCVVAVLPPLVEPAGFVMTENLAQFTLVLGVASLVEWLSTRRRPWLLLSAVAVGYSGVTRPAFQVLGLVLALALIILSRFRRSIDGPVRRNATMAAGALVAGTLLFVGSLSVFNQRHFGYFGVAPTLGFHLTTKTILFVEQAPDEYARVRDLLMRERAAELVKPGGLHDGSQTIWNARAALMADTGLTTPQLSSYLLRMNLALIRHAPLPYLRDVAQSAARYWLPAGGPLADFDRTSFRALWLLLHVLVVGALAVEMVAFLGTALVGGGARAMPVGLVAFGLSAVVVFYTMAITCLLDIGEPRQRRATDLLILFMAVLGVHLWRELRHSSSS